ncbi:MAG: GNAT family N-acetyltransferase [Coriobacteriia bacterium]|nr:GNAT family N-acetyltransferase [Coriobacteriia bacterium]
MCEDRGVIMRPAMPGDFADILRLNEEWECFTSPLAHERLAELHEQALYHRVCEADARVVAFLLAFGPGVDYDSPNYRFFDTGSHDFIYIDRIVIDRAYQRVGLGDALYGDLLDFGRSQGVARLVCEVDADPLNTASERFHAQQGFVEVGSQWVAGGSKRVSLKERAIVDEVCVPLHS